MATLNTLGQVKVPSVFAKIQVKGFADLMNITGETKSKDTGGRPVKSDNPNVYTNIPVSYRKNRQGMNLEVGGQSVAVGHFILEFPVYHNGARINLNADSRFKILARGLEPEKVFSIKGIPFDNQGVMYEVECEQES